MSRALDDLSSEFRPLAVEFLARLTEAGISVIIVDTLRTEEEHLKNLAEGKSKAARSRHLPRRLRYVLPESHPDCNKSDAMDIVPYEIYQANGPDKPLWDSGSPIWKKIGAIAESISISNYRLIWGGRWKVPYDPGHVELLKVPTNPNTRLVENDD